VLFENHLNTVISDCNTLISQIQPVRTVIHTRLVAIYAGLTKLNVDSQLK